MNNLAMALVRLCKHNRDGAFATQANRRRGLVAIANDLHALGYRLPSATSLKPKHVHALIEHWRANGRTIGTIKNRIGWLRWWAAKVNKASILPRTNAELGLTPRSADARNRAWRPEVQLADPRHQAALDLMTHCGLRLEEALKLRIATADQGRTLRLQGSWTKGGRPRDVPLTTPAARQLAQRLHQLTGTGSLVPPQQSYIHFRRQFERAIAKAGLKNVHGLRHQWAQDRYRHLTGWACPKAGGPRRLTGPQQLADRAARLQVARELGHGRASITTTYLG